MLTDGQKHLLSDTACQKIEAAINEGLSLTPAIKLTIQVGQTADASKLTTPAMQKQAQKQSNDQAARDNLKNDPVLNSLLSELNIAESDIEISSVD